MYEYAKTVCLYVKNQPFRPAFLDYLQFLYNILICFANATSSVVTAFWSWVRNEILIRL